MLIRAEQDRGVAERAGAAAEPVIAESPQEAAARMFRSIRAGRSWLRTRTSDAAGTPVPACIAMKNGSDGPPLFMLPGAPGSVLQLAPIAAAVSLPNPVYAIKPRGLEPDETPCHSVAEMAEYAVVAMRAVYPSGPYLLLGYSAGGLVALEIARQLSAAGASVPLVLMLDTYPSKAIWPLSCHLEIIVRQSLKALWTLRRYAPERIAGEVARRLRNLLRYLAESGVKGVPPHPVQVKASDAASRRVYFATYQAGEAYRPVPYHGKIVFVQPSEIPNLEPRSPAKVWGGLLTDFEVRRVPGSHLGMMESEAPAIAALLDEYIVRASRPSPARTVAPVSDRTERGLRLRTLQPSVGCE